MAKNLPPTDMLLWHKDSFELVIKKEKTNQKLQ